MDWKMIFHPIENSLTQCWRGVCVFGSKVVGSAYFCVAAVGRVAMMALSDRYGKVSPLGG